ncbi:alpha/beta hydrolase [Streptomyces sp. NPDC005728]|uniref:alpha/beta fold hydrolase n=1 Tax=Streptomyces sp. NPDC005728 TaxID=3157054 RepID=UPI0033ED5AE3
MASIVLVHGIAQEQLSADDLESDWLPSLAGGVRNAGHPGLADQLWPLRPDVPRPARMAFYGNLFLSPDQQGADTELDSEQLDTADEIAFQWLTNALDSTRPKDAGSARWELQALQRDRADAQGLGAAGGRIVDALDHIPWLSQAGLAGLARINKTLAQIVRYLTEPDIRARAIGEVHRHLDINTRVVIGHSLGSVVAYEAIRAHQHPLPLLITLGSPLGLSTINRRLQHPPAFPPRLARWVNLADRDDIVAARPHLAAVFDVNRPPTARFVSTYTVDNGARPHSPGFYLTKTTTGQAIAEAMNQFGTD